MKFEEIKQLLNVGNPF